MADNRKYSDRAKYLIKAVDKRRKKLRQQSVKYLGGKCQLCGYKKCTQALVFQLKVLLEAGKKLRMNLINV